MSATSRWDEGKAREIVDRLRALEGATLPILHALQDEFGFVDASAVGLIADGPGGLARGLVFSAVALWAGALLAWRQRPL